MLIKFKRIDPKSCKGQITILLQDIEDVWNIYNLIQVGDCIRAKTQRKVQTESCTGSVQSHRVTTELTIKVETVDFHADAPSVRVKGKNIVENEYVKLGAYHTIEVQINSELTLAKHFWDTIALEQLTALAKPESKADLSVILMQDGIAHILLVTPSMVLTKSTIEMSVGRKQYTSSDKLQQANDKFFLNIYQSILLHIDFSIVQCVVLASPGFVKDKFHHYMIQTAFSRGDKQICDNRGKFLLIHSSSGHKHALNEILSSSSHLIQDTKAAKEVAAFELFSTLIEKEPDKVCYGFHEVTKANELLAIDTVLISDSLFRSSDPTMRAIYVHLIEATRKNGSKVRIFSSSHISGQKLKYYTGIAAILRLPLPDLDELVENDAKLKL